MHHSRKKQRTGNQQNRQATKTASNSSKPPANQQSSSHPTPTSALGKHVLAAYYNDARRNILLCLNDIREKAGRKPMENEDQIRQAFSDLKLGSSTPERQDELIKQLRSRFHFLDPLTDPGADINQKNKQDNATPLPFYYESHLNWMLELVNGLRNSMAHPVDDEITIPLSTHKKLYHALRRVYDRSFHEVKKRFGHETATMQPFQRCGKDGRPKKPPQFSFALCLDPKRLPEDSDLPQSSVLHDFGHVLFCSLFLEKSQSAELIKYFLDKTGHGASWTDTTQRTIIREMIAVYRLRLPLQRLKSDDTASSVAMDTVSELSRCPRALLEMLGSADKNHFRGEPGGDAVGNGGENEADTYLFVRSRQDRFIPLMMRFFDFTPDNRLRFAVDLGQFYFNVRLKPASQFADEAPRVRRLSQKILAYGRLQHFETAEKPADWQQLEANYKSFLESEESLVENAGSTIEQLKPYLVKTYPHYHYFEDKIGFRLDDNNSRATYPDLQAEDADQHVALQSPKGKAMQPEFWMSPAQMLHLSFYTHLQQANALFPPLHRLLAKYQAEMRRLLQKLRQGNIQLAGAPHSDTRRMAAQQWINQQFNNTSGNSFQIALSALPTVVIQYLLGAGERQIAVAELMDRARHLLERTEARQRRLTQQLQMADKKRGQTGFQVIKCGPIGDFLAEDLLRFQPVDGNKPDGGKINSQQYQILQKALAYYGVHINEPPRIVDLLKAAGLLDEPFAHPFIAGLELENHPDKYRGLISFYEAYLQARGNYLRQFIREHQHRPHIHFVPHWLRLRQPSTLSSWLDEQLDQAGNLTQPLPLANNMLYAPLLQMVAKTVQLAPSELEAEGMQRFERAGQQVEIRPAVTWLIKRYLAGKDDMPQRMYSEFPRRHNLFDTFLDRRKPNERFKEKQEHCLLETDRKALMTEVQTFVGQYYPKTDAEVERIRREMAKPHSKQAGSPAAQAIKLKSLLRAYKQDEQQVRFSVSQDMLLYLYASQYLDSPQFSQGAGQPSWSLYDLEKTLLNTEIDYRLAVPNTDRILFHPSCKIRDRGELALLVRDRRLPSLLKYYPQDTVLLHHAEIRHELDSYRRAKVEIMALVHQLELGLIARLTHIPERSREIKEQTASAFGKGRHGDFLYALHQYAQQQSSLNAQDFSPDSFQSTLLIRNALSHNEYPAATAFSQIAECVCAETVPENPANHRKVAERLQLTLATLYKPWLELLA